MHDSIDEYPGALCVTVICRMLRFGKVALLFWFQLVTKAACQDHG
jgi:hypothetical protein